MAQEFEMCALIIVLFLNGCATSILNFSGNHEGWSATKDLNFNKKTVGKFSYRKGTVKMAQFYTCYLSSFSTTVTIRNRKSGQDIR